MSLNDELFIQGPDKQSVNDMSIDERWCVGIYNEDSSMENEDSPMILQEKMKITALKNDDDQRSRGLDSALQGQVRVRCCLLRIYMPAIDRPLSDCMHIHAGDC